MDIAFEGNILSIFKNSIKNKKIVCYGSEVLFALFNNVWTDGISAVVDDNESRIGREIATYGGEKHTIKPVDALKEFDPSETVIIFTIVNEDEKRERVNQLGFFDTIEWRKIKNYDSLSEMDKFLVLYKIKQIGSKGTIRIAHIASHGGFNAGDNALNYCLRHLFQTRFPNAVFDLYKVHDAVSEKTIDIINKHDLLVIGGGGLFMDNSNKNEISGWQWAIPENLISEIKIPMAVFAVGYNYFFEQPTNSIFKNNIRALVEQCDFVGLRNYGSIKKVKEICGEGIEEKVQYQPCITTLIDRIFPVGEKKKNNRIAVNLSLDYAEYRFGQSEDAINLDIAMAIKEIHGQGYNIIVTIHCNRDWMFINYLRAVGFDDFEVFDMKDLEPGKVIDFYRNVEGVISSRGHGQMIPFGTGTKMLTLVTQPKNMWFLEDMGLEDYSIMLTENNNIVGEIIEKMDTLMNDDSYYKRIAQKKDEMMRVTEQNMETIRESI